jgi:hypothetical protein
LRDVFDEKSRIWEEFGDREDGGTGALRSSFTIEHMVFRGAEEVGDLSTIAGVKEPVAPAEGKEPVTPIG